MVKTLLFAIFLILLSPPKINAGIFVPTGSPSEPHPDILSRKAGFTEEATTEDTVTDATQSTVDSTPDASTTAPEPHLIQSDSITNWGNWAEDVERCPEGTLVEGFQIKYEGIQGLGDDTAMNGLRLFCGDPNNPNTTSVTSMVGDFGDWGKKFFCPPYGFAKGFQLRVEGEGHADETATNNIRIFCDSAFEPVEADGGNTYGEWGSVHSCEDNEAFCGLQTQVQPDQGNFADDTALNNVAFLCCPLIIDGVFGGKNERHQQSP